MKNLRPDENIQRFLISTPSRFVGEFESENFFITHAWHQFDDKKNKSLKENPWCRNYYVVTFHANSIIKEPIIHKRNFHSIGIEICIYMSILFGKRFDFHGFIEDGGSFKIPRLNDSVISNIYHFPQSNHAPRKDLEIDLNLVEFIRIESLLTDLRIDDKFIDILTTAGKFYLQALQICEKQPEIAYLNLITSGEVLSNYFDYDSSLLLPDETKKHFSIIENSISDSEKIIKHFKKQMMAIKKRFVLTLNNLVNKYFFSHSECDCDRGMLKRDTFKKQIGKAYDLRSNYLHTGISFGDFLLLEIEKLNEVPLAKPVLGNKNIENIISSAPTFIGLERIIRFCLLRFIHLHGIKIDDRLDDDN